MTPQELQEWIAILGKPTAGIVAIFILVLYRESVIHFIDAVVDILASWLKRT